MSGTNLTRLYEQLSKKKATPERGGFCCWLVCEAVAAMDYRGIAPAVQVTRITVCSVLLTPGDAGHNSRQLVYAGGDGGCIVAHTRDIVRVRGVHPAVRRSGSLVVGGELYLDPTGRLSRSRVCKAVPDAAICIRHGCAGYIH